jgi:hypothetical protein
VVVADLHGDARDLIYGEAGNPRKGRHFGGQMLNEILDGFCRSLYFNGDSGGGISNGTSKVPADSETIDVWPESNSLHDAGNFDLAPNLHTLSARDLL